jgi:hypothetical protein
MELPLQDLCGTGFDAGHLQKVVHGLVQAVGALPGHFEVAPLLRVQGGGEEYLEHAQDAVERCAQFVAHVGQELGLGLVGGLGLAFGLEQFAFGVPSLGDVAGKAGQMRHRTLFIGHGVDPQAVDSVAHLLVEDARLAGAGGLLQLDAPQFRGFHGQGVEDERAGEFLGAGVAPLGRDLVGGENGPVGGEEHDRVGGGVEQGLDAAFLVAQLGHVGLALVLASGQGFGHGVEGLAEDSQLPSAFAHVAPDGEIALADALGGLGQGLHPAEDEAVAVEPCQHEHEGSRRADAQEVAPEAAVHLREHGPAGDADAHEDVIRALAEAQAFDRV